MPTTIRCELKGKVAQVVLNRPSSRNAMNPEMVQELTRAFTELGAASDVQVIVLSGEGSTFCAGADLNAMRTAAEGPAERNIEDAERLAALFKALDAIPMVVVAAVKGAAFGGGIGLIACADSVLAEEGTVFAFSEVRLGLMPSIISPYVVRKIGFSAIQEMFLSGERFDASRAKELGLVHRIVPFGGLDAALHEKVEAFLAGAPEAQAEIKKLVRLVNGRQASDAAEETAQWLARRRASPEAREGILAFLEKRKPRWPSES